MQLLRYLFWVTHIALTWSQIVPAQACDVGWFGTMCQYKCHCINTACDLNGLCGDGVCENGWFGPQCQYENLLNIKDPQRRNWLNDGNASTCNPDHSITVTENVFYEIPITWLRLQVNLPSSLQEFQVTFSDRKNESKMSCKNMRTATVNERTLDIHCDMDEVVQFVTLEGGGVKSLCSLYISGGRNVALRQKTAQSTTYSDFKNIKLFSSANVVDGNVDSDYIHESCTSTTGGIDQNPNWNVTLSSQVIIQRYIVYNRENQKKRIKGFTLRSFTKDRVMVFNFTDMEDEALLVYKITSPRKTPPVSIVNILANRKVEDGVLNMCEVELYGDSVCPPSMYGRECQYTCNCAVRNESCFVSNGGCPSGCAAGYHGEDCKQPCDGCSSSCSQFCATTNTSQSPCFLNNGSCGQGCLSGYLDAKCENNSMVSCDKVIHIITIVVPMVALVILVVMAVLGVILCKRMRTSNEVLSTVVNSDNYEEPYHYYEDLEPRKLEATNLSITRNECKQNQAVNQENTPKKTTMKKVVHDTKEKIDCLYISMYDCPNYNLGGNNSKDYVYSNPAFGMSPTYISVRELSRFVTSQNKVFFQQQFDSLPVNTKATMNDEMRKENKHKNRYKNICAYDHSRVLLKTRQSKEWGDYINASYIRGYKGHQVFIASQSPTKAILEDFIRMFVEKEVELVVMLTNLTENGKQKCERYWPEDDVINIGDYKVELITTHMFTDYTIRKLQILKDGNRVHELTQFHFTAWPDKDVPTNVWSLVDFEQRVASVSTDKPIVVHCNDGFGRTGTFIALCDVIMEAKDTGYIDFFTAVQKLRQDRPFMVQTSDQYEFLHRAAMVAVVCMGTTISSNNITERIEALKHTTESGESMMYREFKTVCDVCDGNISHCDGKDPEQSCSVYENEQTLSNKPKNRFQNVLASENYRVILMGDSDEGLGDYINAVFIPSFRRKSQQILTQIPLPTTVNDFWRMVTQYKVTLVVAFEVNIINVDSSIGNYFPLKENKEISTPYFTIKSEETSSCDLWVQHKLILRINTSKKTSGNSSTSSSETEHWLTHITCKGTLNDQTVSDMLTLMTEVRSSSPVGDGTIVYMCRNGAEYSGLVCVLSLLLDTLDNDLHLNIPLVVGAVKTVRPQVIPTFHQYNLLYQVVQVYNDTKNVYCNFLT